MDAHVDGAHAALAQLLLDPVAADGAADQVVDEGQIAQAPAVLRAMEDVVVVAVVAIGAGTGHGNAS
ncbi:MAG: hypothetical protein E6J88_10295 [Deltaproteobacteria bacterium]|nr:MAG: hypothetical protein E6J88_10295 [Deltaproteobacteria bacterium]